MFLTVDEYAKTTGLSRRTIYKWIKGGRIDYRRGPGKLSRIYIPIYEVPTFVRNLKKEEK